MREGITNNIKKSWNQSLSTQLWGGGVGCGKDILINMRGARQDQEIRVLPEAVEFVTTPMRPKSATPQDNAATLIPKERASE